MKRCIALASVLVAAGLGCDTDTFLNQTATFGPAGGLATAGAPIASGGRGTFMVFVENNTPFRAIFTYGAFDNTDERTAPVFFQASPNSQLIPIGGSATLEANSTTGVVRLPCGRVFSVGSRSLLNLVDKNGGAVANLIDDEALIDGVGFADAALTADGASDPNQGFAGGFEALLGVDFNCGSLLNVRLEFNDVGENRFRVDMDVFPSRGDGS
jgi:hypothetical protein